MFKRLGSSLSSQDAAAPGSGFGLFTRLDRIHSFLPHGGDGVGEGDWSNYSSGNLFEDTDLALVCSGGHLSPPTPPAKTHLCPAKELW